LLTILFTHDATGNSPMIHR